MHERGASITMNLDGRPEPHGHTSPRRTISPSPWDGVVHGRPRAALRVPSRVRRRPPCNGYRAALPRQVSGVLHPIGPNPFQTRLRGSADQLDAKTGRAAVEGEGWYAVGTGTRRLGHVTTAFEVGGVRRHIVGPVADVMDPGARGRFPKGPGDTSDDLQPGQRPRVRAPKIQNGVTRR